MKRICPKCGGHTFRAYQKRVHAVIVNEENQQIREDSESAVEFEEPTGPYECVDCGEEFDSLDDLQSVTTYSNLVITNLIQIFEEPLPLDTKEETLLPAIREVITELSARRTDLKGYYCWMAPASYGGTDRKGMLQSIRVDGQNPEVRVYEDPGTACLQISIPALQRIQKRYPIHKVASDKYLIGISLVHAVEAVLPVKVENGEISLHLVSLPAEFPVILTLPQATFGNVLIRYKSNEDGISGLYSNYDLLMLYQETVDKTEYSTFAGWKDDMFRSGVFEQI